MWAFTGSGTILLRSPGNELQARITMTFSSVITSKAANGYHFKTGQ